MFNENIDLELVKLQENEVINIKWVTMNEFDEMVKAGEIAEPILYDYGNIKSIIFIE